ncbi:hypothetical protein SAMN04488059_10650 [Devosia psychrophila]|uniref:Uncharacterized protein n=1 Tax=Devosia psychrophila TaxID=728005 RepID=A0A1I1JQC6_9HYPH|nr:hypothetical protein SAMN04488059_10650 [Devosia psychrophila]
MVIKAIRVRASTGAGVLARHLINGDDNESIEVVRGTVADLTMPSPMPNDSTG